MTSVGAPSLSHFISVRDNNKLSLQPIGIDLQMKKSKRHLKKRLRKRETALNARLHHFINNYDNAVEIDEDNPVANPESEKQFRLLLSLRHLVCDYLWIRLKIHRVWPHKKLFLELPDFDEIIIRDNTVHLKGDIVWWIQGVESTSEWWPTDHQSNRCAMYKGKIRGDMYDGKWIVEPITAVLKINKNPKRNAKYEIEFGYGRTYLKISNK